MLMVRKGQVQDHHTLMTVLFDEYKGNALFTSELGQAKRRLDLLDESLGTDVNLDQLPFKLGKMTTPTSLSGSTTWAWTQPWVNFHGSPTIDLGLGKPTMEQPAIVPNFKLGPNFCSDNPTSCTTHVPAFKPAL